MRVLHVSSPHTWRGGEQQLAYLVHELQLRDVEQTVLCPAGSAVARYCAAHALPHATYRKVFAGNPLVALRIARLCSRDVVDLVHAHDAHAHGFAVLAASLFGNQVPIVVSRRVDLPVADRWSSRFKYDHPSVRKIVCVSNAIRDITARSIRDPGRLTVVHSGIDLTRFSSVRPGRRLRDEFSIPDDHALVGSVAALGRQKDYPTFVRTARRLVEHGLKARFVAIGEGPERAAVERMIEQEGMGAHLHLAGFRTNVPELLAELDVFLITSRTEGLGTSILDALASGIPVVATRAGGIVEIIEDGTNGLLADVGAVDQLADAVGRMLRDTALRERCIGAGRETAARFSKEETARGTLEVYREVLGRAVPRARSD